VDRHHDGLDRHGAMVPTGVPGCPRWTVSPEATRPSPFHRGRRRGWRRSRGSQPGRQLVLSGGRRDRQPGCPRWASAWGTARSGAAEVVPCRRRPGAEPGTKPMSQSGAPVHPEPMAGVLGVWPSRGDGEGESQSGGSGSRTRSPRPAMLVVRAREISCSSPCRQRGRAGVHDPCPSGAQVMPSCSLRCWC
jgi:hypothetical protein